MATSGSSEVNAESHGYVKLRLSWSQLSQNVSANQTTIRLTLQVVTNQYGAMYGTAGLPWSINCNGTTNGSWSIQTGANQTRTIGTRDVTITHDNNGNGSFSASASATFNMNFNGWVGSVSVSVSGSLNSIARASRASVSGTLVTGNTITVNTNRASSSFTHKIRMNYGYKDIDTFTNVGASVQVSLDTADYAPQCTDRESRGLWIYCTTYNGGTQIGSEQRTDVQLKVADSVKPTVSTLTLSDANGYYTKYGGYVQGKSNVKAAISASGAYGSTISEVKTTMGNQTATGTSVTLGSPTSTGNVTVTTTAKDSRGRTGTKSATINVLAYSAPKLTGTTAARTPNDESTTIRVTVKGSTTNLGNKNTNTATVKIEYRQAGTSSWTQANSANRGVSWNYTYDITGRSESSNWEIRVTATDQLGSATESVYSIGTAQPILDFKANGKGLGIGAIADTDNVAEVGWKLAPSGGMLFPWYVLGTNDQAGPWVKLGSWSNATQADVCIITIYGGNGQNGRPDQNTKFDIFIKKGFTGESSGLYFGGWVLVTNGYTSNVNVKVIQTGDNSCDVWVRFTYTYDQGWYMVSIAHNSAWSPSSEKSENEPSGTSCQVSLNRLISADSSGLATISSLTWSGTGLGGRVYKKIWSGTLNNGGSITVSDIQYYNVFAAIMNGWSTMLLGARAPHGAAAAGYSIRLFATMDDGNKIDMYNFSLIGDTATKVTMQGSSRHGINNANYHDGQPMTALYGII